MVKLNVLLSLIKHHSIGVYLFAFLIPLYPKWLGYGILFIVLEQLIKRNFASISSYKQFFNWKNSGFWLLLFYLMHFIGMTYSENSSFGWMDIGMKSSFAIFPIIFILFKFKINQSYLFKSVIIGAFLGILICFYLSYLNYAESGNTWHFRESYLSHFMHRSYWASYLALAYTFSFYLVVKKQMNFLTGGLLSIMFLAIIFISGSKAGILIAIISTIVLLFYIARVTRKIRLVVSLSGIAVIILIAMLSFFPSVTNRILSSYKYATGQYSIDVEKTESTASRILMWETSIDLIKEKPFLGVGTGDVKDALVQKNLEKGYVDLANRNLNAHNQFLNSWVAIGFLGFLFLVFCFLSSFINAPSEVSFIQRLIVFVLFSSLLAEAFLETQAGIIPVAFFLTLLSSLGVGKGSLLA